MAIYNVLKRFKDVKTGQVYEVGQRIEMTVKRADEAIKNLKKHNVEFLEEKKPPKNKGE